LLCTRNGWVAASTAFKAPTLEDLYVDLPAFDFFANPNLDHKNRDTGATLRRRPDEQLRISSSKRFAQFSIC
jgi:hypothetical protein